MNNQNNENREHCKGIADTLEAIVKGELFICPNCGEWIGEEDSEYNEAMDEITCKCCNADFNSDEADQVSMYDYFNDVYDIEYRVGSDRKYRSVKVMVACGGPNIYIDTAARAVQLYWWTDYAEYPISRKAANEIDEFFEEVFSC